MTAAEAKSQLSSLLDAVEAGQAVVITRRGKAVARVVRESRGVPAAIEGMLAAAVNEREVTRRSLHNFHHESAIAYIDMTPMLLVVAVVAALAVIRVSRRAHRG